MELAYYGDLRKRKIFLLFPMKIRGKWYWWQYIDVVERYEVYDDYYPMEWVIIDIQLNASNREIAHG